MPVSDKTEAKRMKSSALPWFVTSRVSVNKRIGLSDAEQACLALELDGMPCPMDIDAETWVRTNFSYICSKYMEKYPKPSASLSSHTLPKVQKKLAIQARNKLKTKNQSVRSKQSGIDVTTAAFLDTYEWRKLRMEALIKYGRKCMCCGATPETGGVMNVDHIKPRKRYPELALKINNLQILCHDCNHGKGNWNETDWRNK